MAREKMVTRTITRTNVKAMLVNIAEKEVFENFFQLAGEHDEKSALNAIAKKLNTNEVMPVSIVSLEKEEVLYGMTEEDFVLFGHVMTSRTKI